MRGKELPNGYPQTLGELAWWLRQCVEKDILTLGEARELCELAECEVEDGESEASECEHCMDTVKDML